jgi:hypothetical protein
VKKLSLAAVLFAALIASSSAQAAKTFVGVLWPMFGPLPAIGLVELTAEIRTMPDVEVHTYLHQEWPDLVKDISHLPEGTRTIIIGYSLGANATSWVVNKSKYIDLVIALQPSMLSWNPTITGRAGRIIEVYNPNTWETFGGMGSKKLEWTAGNIEYMPNNDSHPGAQFNPEFRSMVKTEIAKMTSEPAVEVARTEPRTEPSVRLGYAEQPADRRFKDVSQILQKDAAQTDTTKKDAVLKELVAKDEKALAQKDSSKKDLSQKIAAAGNPTEILKADDQMAQIPMPAQGPQSQPDTQPAKLVTVAADFTQHQPQAWTAFLETLSGSVNSGNLAARELTVADMMNYAQRTFATGKSDSLIRKQASLIGGDMIVASNIDPHRSEPSGPCCAFVKADGGLD